MQTLLHGERWIAGIAFACGIVVTSVITAPIAQVLAQKTPEKILVAQSVVTEDDNLKFESRGCSRTKPKQATCDVLVTNMSNQRQTLRFAVSPNYDSIRTNAIDTSGTVYTAQVAQSGSGIAGVQQEYFNISLAAGVPTKVTFTFEIPQTVIELSALDVGYVNTAEIFQTRRIAIPGIGRIASKSSTANSGSSTCPPSSTSTR